MVCTKEQIEAMENAEREKWMAAWEKEFDASMRVHASLSPAFLSN